MDRVLASPLIVLDLDRQSVIKNGVTYFLSRSQYRLLYYLCLHCGQPVPRDKLMEYVWGPASVNRNELDRCISQLRKILEEDPKNPKILITIYRLGYVLTKNLKIQYPSLGM